MKKALFILHFMVLAMVSCAQEKQGAQTSETKQKEESKLEQFVSKSGGIVRYINYNLPSPKLLYRTATAMVRAAHVGDQKRYFLIIESKDDYRTSTAAIAHEDLLEIVKAFEIIKDQLPKDVELLPDYLENRFVSDDGFMLGYYVNKKEMSWFIGLERFGSGNTIFPRDEAEIDKMFYLANEKINELVATGTD